MVNKKILFAGLLLLCFSACVNRKAEEQNRSYAQYNLEFEAMDLPAAADSFYPRLAVSQNRKVLLMSWYSQTDSETSLHTASYEAGSWLEAELVAKGENWFVNWADFPNLLAFGNGSRAISYLQKSGEGLYAYDVHLKLSLPGTKGWQASLVPHKDATQTEHGFVSMAPMQDNSLGIIWLDGRKYASAQTEVEHSHEMHETAEMTEEEMTLRFARINEKLSIMEARELDGRTCDCCQTAMAATKSGLIAVYRDRSAEDVRDIAYVRYENGNWTSPRRLHADEWSIKGCPVNGPAIAAEQDQVVTAWFTAAGGTNKVQLIRSVDEGKNWAEPVLIDDQKPIGRVDVCLLPDKSAAVSWLAEGGKLMVKRVSVQGDILGTAMVTTVEGSRSSGFPQMEYTNNTLFLAWTENGEQKAVKMAKAAL